MSNRKNYKIIFINTGIILFVFLFGIFFSFTLNSLENLQGIQILETYKPPVATKILDIKGRVISEFYRERRKIVDYKDISTKIFQSTLSVEDKRFLSHYGVDLVRIVKALIINLSNMKKEQGGSTITIQLSKLIFLDHKKTYERKIKELWYAFQIEKQYTKKEILNFYFNQINYGHGGYGVEAASQFYFNKSAKDLDIAEASLLSGLPNSPYYYSPIRFPGNSQKRHRTVLIALVNNGMLDPEVASSAYLNFWQNYGKNNRKVQETFGQLSENKAPYFTEYIRNKVESELDTGSIYEKGLVIYTTLNIDHQLAAQKYLWEKLEEQKKFSEALAELLPERIIYNSFKSISQHAKLIGLGKIDFERNVVKKKMDDYLKNYDASVKNLSMVMGIEPPRINFFSERKTVEQSEPQAALISIEPGTGNITAMVGGGGFNYNNQFNRAMDLKRQVGSIIKPFIYAVAVDKNYLTPSTILKDSPKSFDGYIPKNYSQKFRGDVTVRDALKKSINVLAVETLDLVGIDAMRQELAGIFRIHTDNDLQEKFPKNLTMALGSGSFSPFTIATAYAVLANDGMEVIPHTIKYITDENGSIIKNYEVELLGIQRRQLIDRSTAFIIRDIIKDVFQPGGTAYKYNLLKDFKHWSYSMGKTGTTSNWKDAWFAGANSYLSTVVWFGYDDNKSLGRGRTGGNVAAPVWIQYNQEVLNDLPVEGDSQPNNVVQRSICLDCDGLASSRCAPGRIRKEFYKVENFPTQVCSPKTSTEDEEKQFLGIIKKFNQQSGASGKKSQVNNFMDLVGRLNNDNNNNRNNQQSASDAIDTTENPLSLEEVGSFSNADSGNSAAIDDGEEDYTE